MLLYRDFKKECDIWIIVCFVRDSNKKPFVPVGRQTRYLIHSYRWAFRMELSFLYLFSYKYDVVNYYHINPHP